ncbi:MAG TPA: hypothetical protein VHL53_13870 [Acidimicrobiia bacterium]|nr:hypothetical protein [Acidimicrobiia bacterium]
MALVAFASAKGSPGVTTLARALAGVWPRPALLVELDPAGGDLAARGGFALEPGLASLALAARSGLNPEMLASHTQTLPDGASLVVAPVHPWQVGAALEVVAASLAPAAAGLAGVDVLADCGRLDGSSPVLGVVEKADAVVLVARPTLDGLAHLQPWLDRLGDGDGDVGVVLIGAGDYDPKEVSQALAVPTLGVVADDLRGARLACAAGVDRARRTLFVRSAAGLAADLDRRLQAVQAVAR